MTSYKREEKAARQSPSGLASRGQLPTWWGAFFRTAKPSAESLLAQRGGGRVYEAGGALQTSPAARPILKKFHHPEHCPINRTAKRAKISPVRHCGQNAHNEFENMCNFLNKTPLRNGVFFGTIKLCKSVYLELCPEQNWGACQAARDLCGPDNRTAL